MRTAEATILAAELTSHRYWRVDGVGPAPDTVLPGPASGDWVRLSHRSQPEARYVIPVCPVHPEHLARKLNDAGKTPHRGLTWYYD